MSWSPIRQRNADGILVSSGFVWNEERVVPFRLLILLTCVSFVIFAVCLIILLVGNKPDKDIFIFSGLATLIFGICARLVGNRRRQLEFSADGSVLAPRGLPGSSRSRVRQFRSQDFASIETRRRLGPEVVAITRHGQTIRIAHNVDEEEARLIAVQLSMALKDLREAPRHQRQVDSMQSVID